MKTKISISYETINGVSSLVSSMDLDAIDSISEDTYKIQIIQEFLVPNGKKDGFNILSYCRNFYIGKKISLKDVANSRQIDGDFKVAAQLGVHIFNKFNVDCPMEFIQISGNNGETHIIDFNRKRIKEHGTGLIEEDYCFSSLSEAKDALKNIFEGVELINDGDLDLSERFSYSDNYRKR